MKLLKIIKEWKLWLLALLIIYSLIIIHPFSPTSGVLIEGVRSPAPKELEVGSVITGITISSLNGSKRALFRVNNLTEYNQALTNLGLNDTVRVKYRSEVIPYNYETREAIAFRPVERDNETSIGLIVGEVPGSNLNFGLEIIGGTKVLLTPNRTLTSDESENLVEVLKQRLNLFGLKEVPVNFVTDLTGNQYVRIEFAGASEDDVKLLLEKEGAFEGRVGNQTVFRGDEIVDVCISGVQCTMRVEPVYAGTGDSKSVLYRFQFQIDLSQEAAERFANVTNNLSVGECNPQGCYLEEKLDLYLDNELIQDGSLALPESIKGEVMTSATITGTRYTMKEAQDEMRRLQAILQSRSLPVSLEIVSVETLSPSIGEEFAANLFTVMLLAVLVVALIIGIRYRSLKVSLPIILIIIVEIISTLGITALIGITLDLSAIAGLIASIGTSLDDQIIITDEVLAGRKDKRRSVKRRIKEAFFVVITAFTATFVSMMPLAFAGAGLLRGFAITTMVSITIGVLVTRPAYARIVELIFK
ncbi:hypothetical protein GF352_01985 [archaeon]|nr:hypothetical protein [archaeon]